MRRRLGGEMRVRGPQGFVVGLRSELETRKVEAAVARGREEERKQIGQALHDGAGQLLSVALMQLRSLARQSAVQQEVRAIEELHALLKTTLDEVVGLSHTLCPAALERLGLVGALAELAAQSTTAELAVEFRSAAHAALELPRELSIAIYRATQAALANVVRHAHARRCTISLSALPAGLTLEVEDDGGGFSTPCPPGGIGLSGIRERAAALGGTCVVESEAGQGTRVRFEVPRQ